MDPLGDGRLELIDRYLDAGRLDDAQRWLIEVGDEPSLRHGVAYLSARLLNLRGRLDREAFAGRLRDLIRASGGFPRAAALLHELGSHLPAASSPPEPLGSSSSPPEPPPVDAAPEIPAAPRPARFTPPPGLEPPELALPDVAPVQAGARIRSAFPPAHDLGTLPPVAELAGMLDRGEFRRVVTEIDFREGSRTPAYSLMRARALHGAGAPDESRRELERLCAAPLLEPDVRAGTARLLVELGELELALEQARLAFSDDPELPSARVTLALAALRCARGGDAPALVDEARSALDGLDAVAGPRATLVTALRACVEAEGEAPERALALARRALAAEPSSADAALALARATERLGGAASVPDVEADESSPWDASERALVAHRLGEVRAAFEAEAHARLTALRARGAERDLPILASVTANLLTSSVPFRELGPWDLSLYSVARLEAALELLYPTPAPDDEVGAAPLLIGVYLGEALREALHGRWAASAEDPDSLRVVADQRAWDPLALVRARIGAGRPLGLEDLAPSGDAAWSRRRPNPMAPPAPWGAARWPTVAELGRLGRALGDSALGAWCETRGLPRLDLSLGSLGSLDAYADSIAPPAAPALAGERWAERAAVLIGAYLGEALRASLGGHWRAVDSITAPEDFVLTLGDLELQPVSRALERLTGASRAPLTEVARAFADTLGS
ncbi:MAG: hypothetical protein OZ921_18110 [Sorangiineae bacterium]|nr:hypothetical protein [Polyangiaceae bacterium]MEB2324434.1 hypothetical protein [Sorangiineae bacterium]